VEKWRLEHPHDTPPYRFPPSPTFGHSSAAGAGMGSLAAALVGAVLGGVLGYHLLTRLGGGTKSD